MLCNLKDDLYRLSRILRAMDSDSIGLRLGNKLLEILIEMFNDLRADGVGLLSAFAPIRQGFERIEPLCTAALGVIVQCALER